MITLLKLRPYTGAIVAPSPNHDARRAPAIEGIVLHATEDEGEEDLSLSWLRSPKSRVSCHLLVSRAGRVTRLVGDRQRAWHAGLSWWRGTSDVNSITLGIEIANRNDGQPYTNAQYRQVAAIVAHYCRQGLSLNDVVSHEAISGGRKTDPHGWNWDRFRGMVRQQLRRADVEGRPPTIYDRRSDERRVDDEATEYGSPDVPPPSVWPARALEPGGAVVPAAPPKQQVPAITTPKPALHSRTLWVNALTVLAAGGVMLGDTLNLAFSVGFTLPEEITMWALFGVGLVNIALRFRTNCAIACGCPDEEFDEEEESYASAREEPRRRVLPAWRVS